jgi:hypothetical protein
MQVKKMSKVRKLIYCLMVFVNLPVTICMPEEGDVQIQFCSIACDLNPFQETPSTGTGNCGDCTDFKPVLGPIHRIPFCGNFKLPLIHDAVFCLAVEQKTPRIPFHIAPNASSDLIGTSILII